MTGLENLSPIDFENLCLDLAKVLTGKRFEAFGPGPDGGIDGRCSTSERGTIILQCKHYLKSGFSTLLSTMRNEAKKVKKRNLVRYILFTSQSLTPNNKECLLDALNGIQVASDDILCREDIEGLLRNNPDMHKAHIKLWLSSAAVLDRILNSGLEEYTKATREEILDEVKVYVRNPSFDDAINKLEKHKVLIITGPPGVGKTTLAQILTYRYLSAGWRFYAIRSLDEGFAKVDDGEPTIFFFDDFLGRIELNRQVLNQNDSALLLFIKRIQKSKNARFILTSRAHIFEEAVSISDRVSDSRVQVTKFILNLDQYTRRIRAEILFIHLFMSDLSEHHFSELLKGDWIKKIVDHRNYNPRVVSMVTRKKVTEVTPAEFPMYMLEALDNPKDIWEKPYKSLCPRYQHLLITLFFSNERGESITNLKVNYHGVHEILCKKYNHSFGPDDFNDALKTLESGFISISGKTIQYVNPAVQDFLKQFLDDPELLASLPAAAKRADWADRLWKYGKNVLSKGELRRFSESFIGFVNNVNSYPTLTEIESEIGRGFKRDDLPLGHRIKLLVSLAVESTMQEFLNAASAIIEAKQLRIMPEEDGHMLPAAHKMIRDSFCMDLSLNKRLLSQIEELLVTVIKEGFDIDGLISVLEAVDQCFEREIPPQIREALDGAIKSEQEYILDMGLDLNTTEELSGYIDQLKLVEDLSGLDLTKARDALEEKMIEVEEREYGECELGSWRDYGYFRSNDEVFDDHQLNGLFQPLIHN